MNLTLKNVPERVYLEIKREARQQGRSLNAQIVHTLETDAAELQRRRRLGRVRKELDRFAASLQPLDDSAAWIREDRRR